MTLKKEAGISKWNKNSSDPNPETGIPEGSKIHVIDTGQRLIYHNGMWEEDRSLIYAINAV